MRAFVTASIALLLVLPAATLLADDGVIPGTGQASYEFSPPDTDLIDSWNDTQPPGTNTYAGSCFAFPYTAPVDYVLERVEFYAGNIAGTVSVEIRDGDLNGPALGAVTYQEAPPRGWQGENLQPSVNLGTGQLVFIVYRVVVGSYLSAATAGVYITHYWGNDCVTWSGPWNSQRWMARFYGTLATPVESETWGAIKALYN